MIKLSHGAGGKETSELIDELVKRIKRKGAYGLNRLDDGGVIELSGKVVMTTDSFVVKPWRFPGGDIGKLAVVGTVNDLVVMGAAPKAISLGVVVEEGFRKADLMEIYDSVNEWSRKLKVDVIAGDMKVMERGALDGICINSTGIGVAKRVLTDSGLKPGDLICVSGGIGEHGATILAQRYELESRLRSDCGCVKRFVDSLPMTAAKDPTRGGLVNAVVEMAEKSGVRVVLDEGRIPVKREVRAISEMLGIDPLTLACEGRVVFGLKKRVKDKSVKVIGRAERGAGVLLRTAGGTRLLDKPSGEIVPRIC